jgi:hypothetical protein
MKAYGDHRNAATRQENLYIRADEGEWGLYAPVALSIERKQKT